MNDISTKIKEQLSLRNKYFYWSTFILLIAILTWINNYGFYSHVERTSVRTAIQFEKSVLEIIDNYPNQNKEEIQQLIIKLASKWQHFAYYNNGVEIILLNNEIKKIKDTKNWDNTTSSKFIIDINKLINKEEGGFFVESLTSHSQILDSIINSMTFSIKDIYNDIFQKRKSPVDGKIYIKNKESVNDGIIVIKNQDLDIEKKYLLIVDKDNKFNAINLSPYEEILVKEGSIISKDQLISQGSIHTAIYNIQNIYWYRSRITIGFAIFTYLILWLSRKRLEEQRKKEDEFDKQIEEATQTQVDILTKQNKLEEEYKSVCEQFKQYESFVKFAFEDTSIDELLEKNRRILGNMFRLVAEKIVYSIYENEIRPIIKKRDTLDSCLQEIKPLNLLSNQAINALYAVKNFGNDSSHYTRDVNQTSFVKTIVIAKDLIDVIEEYLSLELNFENIPNNVEEKIQNKEKITRSGLRIVKKASDIDK